MRLSSPHSNLPSRAASRFHLIALARRLSLCLLALAALAGLAAVFVPARAGEAPSRWQRAWTHLVSRAPLPSAASASAALFDGPTTFSNTTAIVLPTCNSGCDPTTVSASPFPSNISVSGLAGTVSKVTVTLTNMSQTCFDDYEILLVSPTNQNLMLMSDASGCQGASSTRTYTFDDTAAATLADEPVPPSATGSYKPTNFDPGDNLPGAPSTSANTTLAGAFNGLNPNGTWKLYVYDDSTGDTGQIANGWSITITTANAANTTTMLASSTNPSFTTAPSNTTNFTATVSSTSTVSEGTVTFTDATYGTTLCSNVNVVSGQATCNAISFAQADNHVVTASYSGTANFGASNAQLTQQVNTHTTVNPGNNFCNTGALTIPSPITGVNANGVARPYPSRVFVTGVAGTISKVTVTLNGLTHTNMDDLDVLLVAPGGQNIVLTSDAGGDPANTGVMNANVTFDDNAPTAINANTPPTTGSYKPTNLNDAIPDNYPAPAPAPSANTTLAAAFNTTSANGTWLLYVNDDANGDSGQIASGWCLTFTTNNDTPTTTAVSGSPNPSQTNQQVTFTATVTNSNTNAAITTGTVSFVDTTNGVSLCSAVALNGSGQATCNFTFTSQSDRTITATYSGVAGSFNTSMGTTVQQVNNLTAVSGNQFCNTGAITIPDPAVGNAAGPAKPYPSRINVSGLGTICSLTVTLTGLSHTSPDDLDILLVGPGGQNILLMSDVGGATPGGPVTLTFSDAAASQIGGSLSTGSFKPSKDVTSDTFPVPLGGAAPVPSANTTLAATFGGMNANGMWSLYVSDDSGGDAGAITGGWCLNFTTLNVSPMTLPNAVFGQNYSQMFTASNGTGPYTFALDSGMLPGGFTLTGDTLSGMTTSVNTFNFVIRANDTAPGGCSGTRSYTVMVNKADTTTTITNSVALATATNIGVPYAVDWSVTVNSPGMGTPMGTVTVTDGTDTCMASVSAGTCMLTSTTQGTKTITATYNGDTNFNVSTSPGVSHQVNCPNPTVQVMNNADSGPGSLRQAVIDVCPNGLITFANTVVSPIALSGGQITIDKNLTIQGPGANLLTVQNTAAASATSRVFLVNSGVTATISGLTISGANVSGGTAGGGIRNLGTLTVTDSTISGNSANSGGGISNTSGTLTVTNSTISNNSAPNGGSGIFNSSTLNVTNATISNNSTTTGSGGGIFNSGTSNVTNATISNNSAPTGSGGGIFNGGGGTVNARNSIIAGNTALVGPDLTVTLTSQGYNLIGNTSGATISGGSNDITGMSPMLGSLAFNGGPTQTLALLAGSPALDKGSAANNPVTMSPITTDQRGLPRPVELATANAMGGNGSDIGAYEHQCAAITVMPVSLPNGTVGFAYNNPVSASGGTGLYMFSVTSGTPPTGLTLNSDGTWSGTTTSAMTFNFTVTATDAFGCTGSQAYSVTIAACPALTFGALANGTIAVAYSQNTGPTSGYSYTVSFGSLPPGLMLNAAAGVISGTPTTAGIFNFKISATGCSTTGEQAYTVQIVCPTITLSSMPVGTLIPVSSPPRLALPFGNAGVNYSVDIDAAASPSGMPSFTFTLVAGALPSGFSLSAATGVISGKTNFVGFSNFTVRATGSGGCFGQQAYQLETKCPTITLACPMCSSPGVLPNGVISTAYNKSLAASPTGTTYLYSRTAGTLPPGLSLNSLTGALTGTPPTAGMYSFTVRAQGFGTCTGSQA
ncbi:MAG: hypothetical protein HOP19_21830, partial [Acidobacteria bacterium]|nr:hypothetical protein [Acidobacteriota bacterium]